MPTRCFELSNLAGRRCHTWPGRRRGRKTWAQRAEPPPQLLGSGQHPPHHQHTQVLRKAAGQGGRTKMRLTLKKSVSTSGRLVIPTAAQLRGLEACGKIHRTQLNSAETQSTYRSRWSRLPKFCSDTQLGTNISNPDLRELLEDGTGAKRWRVG